MAKPEDRLADVIQTVAEKIHQLTRQRVNEFEWFKAHCELATKRDLEQMGNRIISVITAGGGISSSDKELLGAVLQRASTLSARVKQVAVLFAQLDSET